MLSQEVPQGFDIQQLMMAMDPNSRAIQNIYMNQIATSNGSPSPSSLPSSGSASTTGNNNGEASAEAPSKTPTPAADLSNVSQLLAGIMPQMAQQNGLPNFLEQMQAMNGLNMFGPLAALQNNSLLNMASPTKPKQKRPGFDDSPMKVSSPQQGMNFTFPFNLAPSTSTASQQSVIVNAGSDGQDEHTPPAQKRMKPDDEEEKLAKNSLDDLLRSQLTGQTTCSDCGKEFGSALGLFTHKTKDNCGIEVKPASPVQGYKCNECDKEFEGAQFLEHHKLFQHNPMAQRLMAMGLPLPQSLPQINFMIPNLPQQFGMDFDHNIGIGQLAAPKQQPATVKRQYSSNGKNYCDLCNKEVCNKYFLRTHMLKMHNIVVDENKTVIANIDTLEKERLGTLSFRCDICHAELKSRQLLRQHKQDSHGVLPPMANASRVAAPLPKQISGPGATMVGSNIASSGEETKCPIPMCERRLSISQLASHIQNDHSGELSIVEPSSPSLECKFCPSLFKEENELLSHQIQTHAADMLGLHVKEERILEQDSSVLRCTHCQYTTKDAKNMEIHVERHERMNEAKQSGEYDDDEALQMTTEVALKMAVANKLESSSFKCTVCSASYSDEASLDAHSAVAHNGLNLSVPKKDMETEKVLERNSHTSGSMSPSTESLPEGFGKVPTGNDKNFVMQSFVLRARDNQGNFLNEIVAHLPVKSPLLTPTQVTFELHPQQ